MSGHKLAPGATAPAGSNFFRLTRRSDGKILLSASLAQDGGVVAVGEYDTADRAQAAGIHWMAEHGLLSFVIETHDA